MTRYRRDSRQRSIFVKVARYPLTWLPGSGCADAQRTGARQQVDRVARLGMPIGWAAYEHDKQKQIAKELSPGAVFYDLGANVGFYTLLAAKWATAGKVYAFEPLPRNIEFLRKHLN